MRIWIAGLLVAAVTVGTHAAEKATTIGRQVDSFELQDFRGKDTSLADLSSGPCVVVVFLGTECPIARLYAPRLQQLADKYADRGVAFVGIDSNRQDSITELAHFARAYGVNFPLLKDAGNVVADQFGAERTPEAFVLDRDRVIRYHGRIDDQYGQGSSSGYAKTSVRRSYVADAIDAILSGQPVSEPQSPVAGCLIGRVRKADESGSVTYANQISRILQANCVECHRAGQIAPFALTEYDEVVGWAEMIEEVVRDQRMPPWHADPAYGHFLNDKSLSNEEKEQIYAWVKSGAPLGDVKQLPEPIDYPEGWQLVQPEEVFYMSEEPYTVPAEGVVEYQYFYVDPQWTTDRWLHTSECLIGNRQVVHHVFVFAIPPEVDMKPWTGPREQSEGASGGANGSRLIGGAAPGTPPLAYPVKGYATHVKAGTKLLFQMHYTPCGREVEDRTCVGFTYDSGEHVKHDARMNMAVNAAFRIPAGAPNHPVESYYSFNEDALILTFAPHMHLRGKAFRYDLEYADGRVETLLNVPRYDFNWQMVYSLAEPKLAPAGSKLHCYARFDNSEENLANPDPGKVVTWGDQTWEEMMIGWFSSTSDIDPETLAPEQTRTARFVKAVHQKPARIGSLLLRAAESCDQSDEAMARFARYVARVAPQVDRVCLSQVTDGKVRFARVAQPVVLDYALGKTDRSYDADGAGLARALAANGVVVHSDLSTETNPDLAAMAKGVGSSLHVVTTVNGAPMLLSFWSKEKNAFPPEAVEILSPLAAKLVASK